MTCAHTPGDPATFLEIPTLEGERVRLEPLGPQHTGDLKGAVGSLSETWYTNVPSPEGMDAEIERRRGLNAAGTMVPFAVIAQQTGRAVGMTTYMNVRPEARKLEIGSTWLSTTVHRTGVNAEAKLLLLTHAFETLGCIAVEFRTHWHNHQSRTAIARLGAKQDGVLRNNDILADGSLRDTVVFSIIESEWPAVRTSLVERLAGRAR